jgi:uncharacterized membrane protein
MGIWWNASVEKVDGMNHVRGILMLVAAAVAVWKGWKIHAGSHAWLAYGLAAVALGMAIWHLTRPADVRRV